MDVWKTTIPPDSLVNVRNTRGSLVTIEGTMDLVVQVGTRIGYVHFLVPKMLSTSVIFGCDFCALHVY